MASPEQEQSIQKYKKLLVISTIAIVIFLFCSFSKNSVISIIGFVMLGMSILATFVFAILMQKKIKVAGGWQNTSLNTTGKINDNEARKRFIERYIENVNRLEERYKKLTDADYGEIGFIRFIDEDIKFSAEGKYTCIKDYNYKEGFHFAFNIYGTKLISTPEEYDDIIDYESNLFKINIGYFDNYKLSPENDNGIIVEDIFNLQGKTIQFKQGAGYICDIETVEMDDIEFGEIEFVEWTGQNHIINFKCIVGYGVSDIIVGKLNLIPDKNE